MRWPGDRVYFDLKAPPDNAVVRAAWSRYMLYGKITVQLASSKAPGMCSAFITFSDVEDEIDFEMIGAAPNSAYTNVFYKGIAEYTHSTSANIGDISALHTYEIDWTSTAIKWSVDGKLLRTVTPGSENAKSTKLPKGQNWFPNTPSLVMFSIWQGLCTTNAHENSSLAGNADWRTAKQQTASFKNFKVQCYNDKNQPVPEWPVGSS
ncbi:concanavalin A-like lectin/glucanase domain-containing protein, partial [Powellomyces hirtus]